ncbi:NAD-dependent epimerase/dehydratase family protein [Sphingobacterium thalpophilum]|uniref:NAD-dependent epimerase/dehydratase family protein n=1 Tax=Sphingobacterium thalpophilum TaxID=259 RepID=UPI0031E0A66C
MKVLITGITGFVGKNLSKYFAKKGISCSGISLRDVEWKIQDWNKGAAVIHLAGKAHDTNNTSDSGEYFKINRDLTIEVFTKFLQSDIRDFFYFSSVKAVADSVEDVLDESHIAQPLTPYGKSKIDAENYLLMQSLPKGKRLFIIRPCMIHGPGNKGNLNLLYSVVKRGIPWPLASFSNQRSFLSVDNLCYLIAEMLSNEKLASGIYNFADDDSLSTNELVELIALLLGKKKRLWRLPISVIRFAVKIGDILPLPLNTERLKKLTESYVVSNQKIKKGLGIESLPLTSIEGLKKTILSFEK